MPNKILQSKFFSPWKKTVKHINLSNCHEKDSAVSNLQGHPKQKYNAINWLPKFDLLGNT